MANFHNTLRANIEQCKAEADMREAARVAARSGACGPVEVCVPNRCRPGAAIKGIFRTLFGNTNCCDCGTPSCGCDAEPACAPAVEPACAPAVTPAPAAEEAVSASEINATPAPAVTEEKVEEKIEETTEEIDMSILPEADPTSVSGKFYNPSNSIVLR